MNLSACAAKLAHVRACLAILAGPVTAEQVAAAEAVLALPVEPEQGSLLLSVAA